VDAGIILGVGMLGRAGEIMLKFVLTLALWMTLAKSRSNISRAAARDIEG
jgi:hypothetical protein